MAREWWPVFRMTPVNGAVQYVRLRETLTDFGGPVRCEVRWVPVIKQRENVNFESRPIVRGFRGEVDLECSVSAGRVSDAACLSTVAGWLRDTTGRTVALSMDDALTFRDVGLRKFEGPRAKGGKTFAGFLFELGVSALVLADAPPDLSGSAGTLAW